MARLAPAITRFLDRPESERRLGPFFLVEQLGRGGFAPVWLAREVYGATELRAAAVKLFSLQRSPRKPPKTPASHQARDRIVAEARALCQVEHPNVVRFYSLPIDEESGVMGLAMEHIAGTPLDQRLASVGRLPVAEVLAVGIAIASALSAVHRAGLVHRDVKPSNVIESAGVYKLIDFGIAAADAFRAPESAPSTPEIVNIDDLPIEVPKNGALGATLSLGLQSGTVGYIDPVCVSMSAPASPASDLYSLGAMLFECLTGKLPAAAAAAAGKGLDDDVLEGFEKAPSLASRAPDAPPALVKIIDSMLDPERSERPPSAEWVAIRFEQIRREIAGLSRALPTEAVGPFRGLGRFEASDRDVYFGRASEVAAAIEMLKTRGLVAISGSSGSGKSSLARAGVLPAVADGGLSGWPRQWDTASTEPGQDPRAAIALALEPFVEGAAAMTPEALVMALADRAQKVERGVILLVDQLEELATVASGESKEWAVALLVRLAQQAIPGVRALVAARRDLLDPLLAMGDLGRSLVRGLLLIEPITELVWGDVLDQALAAYGYTFEDDALRRDLLAELEETAGAMPLAQFALTELWRKRDRGARKVTRAGLSAIGGIAGALERHADATLEALDRAHPGAQEAARSVLLALTTPQGTRSAQTAEDLSRAAGPLAGAVIDALDRARLIVRGDHGVTLAHEALLTQWGKLRAWVAEARQDRLLAGELERDAERWRADPDAVPLWPRRRLAFGEELRKRGTQPLSEDAVQFLKASYWAGIRLRLFVIGSMATVALTLLWFGYVYIRQERARALELSAHQSEIDDLVRQLKAAKDDPEKSRQITDRIITAADTKPLDPPAASASAQPSAHAPPTRPIVAAAPPAPPPIPIPPSTLSVEPPPSEPPPPSAAPTPPPSAPPPVTAAPPPTDEPPPFPSATTRRRSAPPSDLK